MLLPLWSFLVYLIIGHPHLKDSRQIETATDCFSLQEIRVGDVSVIRALFERVICLELPPRKMKVLFLFLNNVNDLKLYCQLCLKEIILCNVYDDYFLLSCVVPFQEVSGLRKGPW